MGFWEAPPLSHTCHLFVGVRTVRSPCQILVRRSTCIDPDAGRIRRRADRFFHRPESRHILPSNLNLPWHLSSCLGRVALVVLLRSCGLGRVGSSPRRNWLVIIGSSQLPLMRSWRTFASCNVHLVLAHLVVCQCPKPNWTPLWAQLRAPCPPFPARSSPFAHSAEISLARLRRSDADDEGRELLGGPKSSGRPSLGARETRTDMDC